MTRNLIGGFLLVLVAVIALIWRENLVHGEDSPTKNLKSRSPLRVSISRAKTVDQITVTRDFTGDVKPSRESQLSFERNGRVLEMLVDEGDAVTQGQLLATIDVDLVAAQLEAAKAQLSQAEAVLAELVSGPRTETIAASQGRVASLQATAKRLSLEFERSTELLANAAISQERYDAAKFQLAAANADRDAAQQQLDELLAGTRVEQLDAQRATVKQLDAQVQTLTLDLNDGKLHAPYSGRIAERLVDEGTVVVAGTTAFRIVEDSALEAWIGISRTSARQLDVGRSYDVSVAGQILSSELVSLRPQLDPLTRTQNAIFRLNLDSNDDVVPGEIVRFVANERVDASGFQLPTTALVPGPRGLWNVFVVNETAKPSVVEQRNVELLYSLGDSSIVKGTLREGEAVVVDGVHRITAGQAIEADETTVEVIR